MNLHQPERQAHETQAEYRERRAQSKYRFQLATRSGPFGTGGRISSREALRNEQRKNGNLKGVYGAGIAAAAARKQRDNLERKGERLRDKNGALTVTGSLTTFSDLKPGPRYFEFGGSTSPEGFTTHARRIWLAGVSAQRGF